MDIAQVLATTFHTVAFVIAWGYFGILARMIVPGLERALDGTGTAAALAAIEARALPLVIGSLVLFAVTGGYLLVTDPKYAGLGNFDSTWATLMLVKHVLVVALVVVGVAVDRLIAHVADAASDAERAAVLGRTRLAAEGATGLGALIVLLTAAAQAAA